MKPTNYFTQTSMKMAVLAIKTMEIQEYHDLQRELSENISAIETKTANELEQWYKTVLDEILSILEEVDYDKSIIPTLKEELKQVVQDNKLEFINIVSDNINDAYQYTSNKTDEIAVHKLKMSVMEVLTQASEKSTVNLSNKAKRNQKKSFTKLLDDYFESNTLLDEIEEQILEEAYLTPATSQGIIFTREPNEEVIEYLENKVFGGCDATLDKLSDKLYDIIIQKAEVEGKHSTVVGDELKQRFDRLTEVEARRISRTEIHMARSVANWRRLKSNPTVEMVMWRAIEDERTRDSHAEQNEMITYIGNIFPNGCRYPLDELGEPEEIINCRCDLEAYYPKLGMVPPEDADCWFEEDMIMAEDYSSDLLDTLLDLGYDENYSKALVEGYYN